jgi:hypothetical protein
MLKCFCRAHATACLLITATLMRITSLASFSAELPLQNFCAAAPRRPNAFIRVTGAEENTPNAAASPHATRFRGTLRYEH